MLLSKQGTVNGQEVYVARHDRLVQFMDPYPPPPPQLPFIMRTIRAVRCHERFCRPARYYGIFRDWDGERTYSRAELAERKGLTLCECSASFVRLDGLRTVCFEECLKAWLEATWIDCRPPPTGTIYGADSEAQNRSRTATGLGGREVSRDVFERY